MQQLSTTDRHRAFLLASERLESLLEEASRSNKDAVPVDHLDALNPEERLTLFTNLGTLLLLAEVLVCWLFGELDPLGGMDFNTQSAHAAVLGAAYGVPLLLCSVAARTKLFKRSFPVLDQLHRQQADLQGHFTAGMNPTQVGIWLSFIIVPGLLTMLPATRAGVLWSVSFAQQALLQTWGSGLTFPPLHLGPLALLLPPIVSCYLAGAASASCLGVRPRHIEVLRDAVRSADAYFRLAAARQPGNVWPGGARSAGVTGGSGGPSAQYGSTVFASSSSLTLEQDLSESEADDDGYLTEAAASMGQVAADAFKTLAMVWLVSRRHVAQLSCILTGINVMYFSMVWAATGDMTAPIVAAMLHAGVECWYGEQNPATGRSRD